MSATSPVKGQQETPFLGANSPNTSPSSSPPARSGSQGGGGAGPAPASLANRNVSYIGFDDLKKVELDGAKVRVAKSVLWQNPGIAGEHNKWRGSLTVVAAILVLAAVAFTILALTGTFKGMPGINNLAAMAHESTRGVICAYTASTLIGVLAILALAEGGRWIHRARTHDDVADKNAPTPLSGTAALIYDHSVAYYERLELNERQRLIDNKANNVPASLGIKLTDHQRYFLRQHLGAFQAAQNARELAQTEKKGNTTNPFSAQYNKGTSFWEKAKAFFFTAKMGG